MQISTDAACNSTSDIFNRHRTCVRAESARNRGGARLISFRPANGATLSRRFPRRSGISGAATSSDDRRPLSPDGMPNFCRKTRGRPINVLFEKSTVERSGQRIRFERIFRLFSAREHSPSLALSNAAARCVPLQPRIRSSVGNLLAVEYSVFQRYRRVRELRRESRDECSRSRLESNI